MLQFQKNQTMTCNETDSQIHKINFICNVKQYGIQLLPKVIKNISSYLGLEGFFFNMINSIVIIFNTAF